MLSCYPWKAPSFISKEMAEECIWEREEVGAERAGVEGRETAIGMKCIIEE